MSSTISLWLFAHIQFWPFVLSMSATDEIVRRRQVTWRVSMFSLCRGRERGREREEKMKMERAVDSERERERERSERGRAMERDATWECEMNDAASDLAKTIKASYTWFGCCVSLGEVWGWGGSSLSHSLAHCVPLLPVPWLPSYSLVAVTRVKTVKGRRFLLPHHTHMATARVE